MMKGEVNIKKYVLPREKSLFAQERLQLPSHSQTQSYTIAVAAKWQSKWQGGRYPQKDSKQVRVRKHCTDRLHDRVGYLNNLGHPQES